MLLVAVMMYFFTVFWGGGCISQFSLLIFQNVCHFSKRAGPTFSINVNLD